MKRILILLFIINQFCIIPTKALVENGSSAILINADTEEILFEKNSEEKKYPASTTKIMTLILIYEAINNQQLSLNDNVSISSYAASMGGSQVYLEAGEIMSVKDLLKSVIIASANDACVALAEYVSGSIEEFVKLMNKKAKSLKLKNTNFINCTGLHDENHYTCAYDLGIMAIHLLKIGNENLYQYSKLKEDYIRDGEFWLVNTNKLLGKDDMITGLKTGYTKEAKYCLVSSATKNNQTLISVVLDEPKSNIRNNEAYELLNYGFSLYKKHTYFKKNDIVTTINLPLTKEKKVELYCKNDISISIKKENDEIPNYYIELINKESFNKDEHIANLICGCYKFPLYAKADATQLSFLERTIEIFLQII